MGQRFVYSHVFWGWGYIKGGDAWPQPRPHGMSTRGPAHIGVVAVRAARSRRKCIGIHVFDQDQVRPSHEDCLRKLSNRNQAEIPGSVTDWLCASRRFLGTRWRVVFERSQHHRKSCKIGFNLSESPSTTNHEPKHFSSVSRDLSPLAT